MIHIMSRQSWEFIPKMSETKQRKLNDIFEIEISVCRSLNFRVQISKSLNFLVQISVQSLRWQSLWQKNCGTTCPDNENNPLKSPYWLHTLFEQIARTGWADDKEVSTQPCVLTTSRITPSENPAFFQPSTRVQRWKCTKSKKEKLYIYHNPTTRPS